MKTLREQESGQALIELAFCFSVLCVFVFGIIDFGRAAYDAEVTKNLAGEGSSMASRGLAPATAAQTVVNFAGSDISLSTQGCVIITVITNNAGTLTITEQAQQCGISASSKIGCLKGVNGCQSSNPTLPSTASTALQSEVSGSSLYVTEVYYNYTSITPIAAFLQGTVLPSQLYSVAYY